MFSCSGAADVAEIGDRAVRMIHKTGLAKMFCLAGISGDVDLIVKNTLEADRLLVLDGCDSDCAKKTMTAGGFSDFVHLRVTDLGFEKGKTAVSTDRIEAVAAKIRQLLGGRAKAEA